jgi:hypothetical protein
MSEIEIAKEEQLYQEKLSKLPGYTSADMHEKLEIEILNFALWGEDCANPRYRTYLKEQSRLQDEDSYMREWGAGNKNKLNN